MLSNLVERISCFFCFINCFPVMQYYTSMLHFCDFLDVFGLLFICLLSIYYSFSLDILGDINICDDQASYSNELPWLQLIVRLINRYYCLSYNLQFSFPASLNDLLIGYLNKQWYGWSSTRLIFSYNCIYQLGSVSVLNAFRDLLWPTAFTCSSSSTSPKLLE